MSDREILEMAEARILLYSYFAAKRTYGASAARAFLTKNLVKLEKFYGKDCGERIRKYMRVVEDNETLGSHEVRP